MATYAGIIAGLASAGAGAYSAYSQSQGGGGGGGDGGPQRVSNAPYATGLQSYLTRMFALNANRQPVGFEDYVSSGGKAQFDLSGAGQFTPLEATRLGLVGENNAPMTFFDPTKQNRFTEPQILTIGAHQANQRRGGKRTGPQTPEEELYRLEQDIQRKERRFRRGTDVKPRRAVRVANQLEQSRARADTLRDQLFGAPNTPGPWDSDPLLTDDLG